MTPWDNNVFLFRFKEAEDRELVLEDRPWSIMNSLLVLRPVEPGVTIPDHDFFVSPFWVQVHGLPVEKMNRANAEIISKRFPKLLAFESNPNWIILDRSSLRVRLEINLGLPVPKGFWLKLKSILEKDLWISYKYEKFSDLCFACGRFGHDNRSCRFTPRNDGLSFGYGPEIRAQGVTRSNIPIEVIPHEVDTAEIRVAELIEQRPLVPGEGSGTCLPCSLGTCLDPSRVRQNQREVVGMRPTYAHDEVPSPRVTSGVVSEDHRTIQVQENILNGIFSLDPPFFQFGDKFYS